jgi:sec-independent protein translocase protein TatA
MFSGGFSIFHWLVVGVIILLLFGKGRFSDMMGDVAKGLKSFKKGMTEDDDGPPSTSTKTEPPRRIADSSTLEVPVDRTRDIDPADRREP